ncbi:hypothetical protein T07_12157 [Trichinella nelsoni]|uniref:Uncharacterized protein n=1 Tax=Trichinella nelsoni TaxID=6336 RepID=A0A0V0RT21_9BILA|nr:hypothetical protein T07_12157 [Trichinella nelsoni]
MFNRPNNEYNSGLPGAAGSCVFLNPPKLMQQWPNGQARPGSAVRKVAADKRSTIDRPPRTRPSELSTVLYLLSMKTSKAVSFELSSGDCPVPVTLVDDTLGSNEIRPLVSLANVSLLLCSKYTACCYLAAGLVAFKISKSYSTCRQACSEGRMFGELRGKLWSEIIARPAIGHLTRAHHCERGDIGRRALNLPGYCLYRQCRFQHCSFCWPLAESVCFSLRSFSGQAARPSKFANGQCPASTSSAWHVGCLRQKQILIKADETPPLGKQAFWLLALSRASSYFATTTTTTTIIIIIIAFAFLIAFAFPIAFAMLPGGVAASLSIYISIGKIDASQLSHGFVEKLTSVVPQPRHPLTNTALTGKPRFSLALQNSPYSQ